MNPIVDHPRWSQATEQRIGESGRRKTLMFNGYEEQVAGLYEGMDLTKYFFLPDSAMFESSAYFLSYPPERISVRFFQWVVS